MAASTEKINYKVLFAKLHTRVDKAVSVIEYGGFKDFSNLPRFATSKEV
jgi:hypothetical protein